MNNVTLFGRLTKDPEVRYGNDYAMARFTVAIDRPPKQDGTKEADYPRVVTFGKQAENVEKYLHKGDRVGIIGRLQTGSYEGKDGNKVYTTDVVASRVRFVETKKDRQENPAPDNSGSWEQVTDEDIPF